MPNVGYLNKPIPKKKTETPHILTRGKQITVLKKISQNLIRYGDKVNPRIQVKIEKVISNKMHLIILALAFQPEPEKML